MQTLKFLRYRGYSINIEGLHESQIYTLIDIMKRGTINIVTLYEMVEDAKSHNLAMRITPEDLYSGLLSD
jgi:hypothetical protein